MTNTRVTPEQIKVKMSLLIFRYARIPDTTMTICAAILPGGFVVTTGESSCVDPANFNKELGEKYAKENALNKAESKLWELEGYHLAMKLSEGKRYGDN